MKIQAHVLSVKDSGDKLEITGQGRAVGSAEWRPWCALTVQIPLTDRSRKSFYVGRSFDITIEPK